MCKYSDGDWKCPHEALPDLEYCIFHLKDENKDAEEFNKGINEILESDEEIINFNGFFFPLETSDFSRHQFYKDVNFKNVVFSGHANFIWAEFLKDVIFINVVFSKKACFIGAKFSEEVNFTGAKFSKKAIFMAKFSKNAYFSHAEFSGYVDFHRAKFSGYVNFFGAKFSEEANFTGAKFSGYVNFGAKFSEKADFRQAMFSEKVNFSSAEIHGIFYFIPKNSKVIKFNNTFFSDNVRIRVNLSQCYFYGSNIEKVDLTDSTWNNDKIEGFKLLSRIYNLIYYSFNSSITICESPQYLFSWKKIPGKDNGKLIEFLMQKFSIEWVKAAKIEKSDDGKTIKVTNEPKSLSLTLNDEKTNVNLESDDLSITDRFIVRKKYGKRIYASQGDFALNWKELEGIYRRLKQSHQKSGDYDISGEFYIQEKECKRRQLGFIYKYFWNIFYRIFCLYGERPYNVILISIITIILFAIFYLFCGVEFTGGKLVDIDPSYINYDLSLNSFDFKKLTNIYFEDFIKCVYTSVITFTTLGYGDVHPVGWSRLFASIESGIGIFMTALFIFVFSRKMIR